MKYLITTLLLLFLPISSFAQEHYSFTNLSIENGLSQITVTAIYQDKKGFMWFGTRNGLNRFDGYTFEIFVIDPENNASISDNHILSIAEDEVGNLWIGTNNGLNKLDRTTNNFKRYFFNTKESTPYSNNIVSALCSDGDGNLWVGTSKGLRRYNPHNDSFEEINIDRLPQSSPVYAIAHNDQKLYVGTLSDGLIVYNTKTKQSTNYKHEPNNAVSLAHNHVSAIYIDRKKNVWVGTHHQGVCRLTADNEKFITYNQSKGLTNNYVRCITESPEGGILVGTFNGLNIINPQSGKIIQYTSSEFNQGELSYYSIYSIFYDKAQTLWMGTYSKGINYYSPYGQKFHFYNPSLYLNTGIGIAGPIVETEKNLYIATEGNGLLEMDKANKGFRYYKMFENADNSYEFNILKSLYKENNGTILCGTKMGTIYSFDTQTKKYTLLHDFRYNNTIYHISRTHSGKLLIGGVNQIGLNFLSKDGTIENKFSVKGKNDFSFYDVRCVLEIEPDVFLIGTRNDGLYYFDYKTGHLENFKNNPDRNETNKITENYVSAIFKDSMGNIWVGTFGGGLSLFDIKTKEFKTYNTKQGLLNNNICAIVEDNNQHLWISSISGISDFDIHARMFKNYTHSSGIKINEFTPHSGSKLSDNKIIFSGNNGITTFDPRKIAVNPYIPPIALENLYINNNKILPNDDGGILKGGLSDQKEIVLKHNESNISIEYSALNYIFPNKNQYAYKLEGFDQEWNIVGSRRMAYYTNIPQGDYTFVVKGSNNDDLWNEEGASIRIKILPPFWKTWWAYCIYILLATGIFAFIFRYFNEKKRLENEIKLKQAEVNVREEFHEARSRLFTNFSHELRTPLTLILSPLEDMVANEKGLPDKIQYNHSLMYNNGQRILRLVNNLMDFQKNESGKLSLKIQQRDIVKFTEDTLLLFTDLAQSRQIDLVFNHSEEAIDYCFDEGLMEKVFFNFLSNAFKNVDNGGLIEVDLERKSLTELQTLFGNKTQIFSDNNISYLYLSILDSGIGIPANELENIFIPFYQVSQNEHSASGTGLGLSLSKSIIEMHHGTIWVESTEGEGAIFKCILPISNSYYSEEDFLKEYSTERSNQYQIETQNNEIVEKENQKKHTILVVEDNLEIRNYIISHLLQSYNIIEASNGMEAIDKAALYLPDLIISDLMMPKMDGMEMVKQIKADIQTSHIPIIMLTARSMNSDIKEGYEIGADDYITKPFNASVLVARVNNIITAREKLKEIYGKKFSLETLGVEVTSLDEKFMHKLYEIMEQNVSNPNFNLDALSNEIGMSRTNLYRKIKSTTDLSPNEFIRNFRLDMGAKLLRDAKLPVSDVYVAVGFNSLGYFSTCFKAYYGVSPSDYTSQHEA